MPKTLLKKYIVVYRSQEHYEVLGHVRALNMKEAIFRAQKSLEGQAKLYEVEEATIEEIGSQAKITFDVD